MACRRAPRSNRGDVTSDGEQTVVRCSDCRSRRRLGNHTLPAYGDTLPAERAAIMGRLPTASGAWTISRHRHVCAAATWPHGAAIWAGRGRDILRRETSAP